MKLLGKIALVSFLTLFIELLVIRLLATEIRIFAYLSNLILLATFIGSGLGMTIKTKVPLYVSSIFIFALTVFLSIKYIVRFPNLEFRFSSGITELLAPLSESYIWLSGQTYSRMGVGIGVILVLVVFCLVLLSFLPLGQYLGRLLNLSGQPLLAYSVNIIFSLLGMWTFNLMSFVGLSPYLGLVLALGLAILLIDSTTHRIIAFVCLAATIVLLNPDAGHQPWERAVTYWSPYQKLTLSRIQNQRNFQPSGWYLEVNNVGYMGLLDLSRESKQGNLKTLKEEVFIDNPEEIDFSNQYDLPYLIKNDAGKVLIIGGGGGNDAAAAIRANVGNVKVVEIDPQILSIGRKYHPEGPYGNTNIKTEVNDGRAFIEKTKEKFDIVIMSLADSHTLSSSLTNVQLDNYLYTYQSLAKVKNLLSDNGILFLSFEVTRPWIGSRIQKTVASAFGWEPQVFEVRSQGAFGWGGIFFVVGAQPETVTNYLASKPGLAAFVKTHAKDYQDESINLLTDSWPYVYLDKPRLPFLHLLIGLIVLSTLVIAKSKIISPASFDWQFFSLGAGFMLFEVTNISRASLIFGNTWMTNLFIISGVLTFILIANIAVWRKWLGLAPGIILLLASLALQLVVPLSFFNTLSGSIKNLASISFLTLPHFFSAIVFAHLFVKAKDKSAAFGSNLLGSAFGGFLEMFSFLWGLPSLLLFTIAFYALGSWKFLRK